MRQKEKSFQGKALDVLFDSLPCGKPSGHSVFAGTRDNIPGAMILNADYRPLSYLPLSICSWRQAMRLVTSGQATTVKVHEGLKIRSVARTFAVPSIIALQTYQNGWAKNRKKPATLTRYSVFLRDRFTCQYCEVQEPGRLSELSFDHVIPRSKGGLTTWENIVTACLKCNGLKRNLSLREVGFNLVKKPWHPSRHDLEQIARGYPMRTLHPDWLSSAYWDIELEE